MYYTASFNKHEADKREMKESMINQDKDSQRDKGGGY